MTATPRQEERAEVIKRLRELADATCGSEEERETFDAALDLLEQDTERATCQMCGSPLYGPAACVGQRGDGEPIYCSSPTHPLPLMDDRRKGATPPSGAEGPFVSLETFNEQVHAWQERALEAEARLSDIPGGDPKFIRDGYCAVCGWGSKPGEPDRAEDHTLPCLVGQLLRAEAALERERARGEKTYQAYQDAVADMNQRPDFTRDELTAVRDAFKQAGQRRIETAVLADDPKKAADAAEFAASIVVKCRSALTMADAADNQDTEQEERADD